MTRKLLVAGNWKLNGCQQMTRELIREIKQGLPEAKNFNVAVFPSFPFLSLALEEAENTIIVGAQTVSENPQGAYTGEVSCAMLKDIGCEMVLVGHSERRELFGETDVEMAKKFQAAISSNLIPVLCCGETLEERESDQTEAKIKQQIQTVIDAVGIESFSNAVIAYEPVWAIGTGKSASSKQAQEVHEFIRSLLTQNNAKIAPLVPILYGGSVNGNNAEELFSMPDVDGGLVGGASLTSADFLAICEQADQLSK